MEPRELNIGTKLCTTVFASDEPMLENGANHLYEVHFTDEARPVCTIPFQKGPVKEAGRNGIHNEDLIAIVIDRLTGFQSGPFACDANKQALNYLRGAIRVLNERTAERRERGVEGTNQL